MSDVTFMNLLRGNRLAGFLRMRMSEGHPVKLAPDYTYAELPLFRAQSLEGELVDAKAMRNQTIELIAPATLRPIAGYKGLVVTNPALYRVGAVPSMQLIDSSNTELPISVVVRFHKDMVLEDLEWLCRVYLIS